MPIGVLQYGALRSALETDRGNGLVRCETFTLLRHVRPRFTAFCLDLFQLSLFVALKLLSYRLSHSV
jgi:hypothetical protein